MISMRPQPAVDTGGRIYAKPPEIERPTAKLDGAAADQAGRQAHLGGRWEPGTRYETRTIKSCVQSTHCIQ